MTGYFSSFFLIHYQLLWVVTPTDLCHLNDPSLYLQNDNNPEDKRTHSLMIKRRILTKLVNLLFDEINDVKYVLRTINSGIWW